MNSIRIRFKYSDGIVRTGVIRHGCRLAYNRVQYAYTDNPLRYGSELSDYSVRAVANTWLMTSRLRDAITGKAYLWAIFKRTVYWMDLDDD